jgi:hypothetical protein
MVFSAFAQQTELCRLVPKCIAQMVQLRKPFIPLATWPHSWQCPAVDYGPRLHMSSTYLRPELVAPLVEDPGCIFQPQTPHPGRATTRGQFTRYHPYENELTPTDYVIPHDESTTVVAQPSLGPPTDNAWASVTAFLPLLFLVMSLIHMGCVGYTPAEVTVAPNHFSMSHGH